MYYIFDDNSGKYLSIKKERLPRRGKTIIAIRKKKKKAEATAFIGRDVAVQICDELCEHGASRMLDLVIVGEMPREPVITTAEAMDAAKESGLIGDWDDYKAFLGFWRRLHGEE